MFKKVKCNFTTIFCIAIIIVVIIMSMSNTSDLLNQIRNKIEGFETQNSDNTHVQKTKESKKQKNVKEEPQIKKTNKNQDMVDAKVADINNIVYNDDGKNDDENSVDGDTIEPMKAPAEIYKSIKANNKKKSGPSAEGGTSGFTGFSKQNNHSPIKPGKVEGFSQNMNRINNNIHKLNNILKSYDI